MTAINKRLSTLERFALIEILPTEGHYRDLKLIRKFRESLSFTEEEQKLMNMRDKDGEPGKVVWDDENDPNKAVFYGKRMEKIVVDLLVTLENSGKLKNVQETLYEKFVGEDDNDDE